MLRGGTDYQSLYDLFGFQKKYTHIYNIHVIIYMYIYIYNTHIFIHTLQVEKKNTAVHSAPVPSKQSLFLFMRNFVLTNMETICTVACRDSGKTVIDAMAP